MALRSVLPRRSIRLSLRTNPIRCFATVEPITLVGKAPQPPQKPPLPPQTASRSLDALVLSELHKSRGATLPAIVTQYVDNAGHVLQTPLPYESRPDTTRRVAFDSSDGVVLVAHAFRHGDAHKVALCTGFVLNASSSSQNDDGGAVVLSCAHTLEEVNGPPYSRSSPSVLTRCAAPSASGSFIISTGSGQPVLHPVQNVLSSLHRSDLLLLSTASSPSARRLPLSPYPAQPGTAVRAHVVVYEEPDEEGWTPWVGATWSKWVRGTILGYRDFAGREAQPGTYDALSHMLFKPLPTPGSSGGPIVDEESGAVVGVMLGTRMDNRVEGLRGWGVPSEAAFEMFSLPGLNLTR
ncbi:hypothetical protein BDW22DRAFT_1319135 [Trametopsis cervina]|nr:hypothetical protein BDW22DRAFT_1319135 [Trametopsis cervina]